MNKITVSIILLFLTIFSACSKPAPVVPKPKHLSINDNQLQNPGFEKINSTYKPYFWDVSNGKTSWANEYISPYAGHYYLYHLKEKALNGHTLSQSFNLQDRGFDLNSVDQGLYSVDFGGYHKSFVEDKTLQASIELLFFDANAKPILTKVLELKDPTTAWQKKERLVELPKGTRTIKYAIRVSRSANVSFGPLLDDMFLYIKQTKQAEVIPTIEPTYTTFSQTPTFELHKTGTVKVPLVAKKDKKNQIYDGSVNPVVSMFDNNKKLYVYYQVNRYKIEDYATQTYNFSTGKLLTSAKYVSTNDYLLNNGKMLQVNYDGTMTNKSFKNKQLAKTTIPKNVMPNQRFILTDKIALISDGNLYLYSKQDLKVKPVIFKISDYDGKNHKYNLLESDDGKIYLTVLKKVFKGKSYTHDMLEKVGLLDLTNSIISFKKNITADRAHEIVIFEDKLAFSTKNHIEIFSLTDDKLLYKVNTVYSVYRLMYDKESHILISIGTRYNNGPAIGKDLILVNMDNKTANRIKLPMYGKNPQLYTKLLNGYLQINGMVKSGNGYISPLLYVDLKSLYAFKLYDQTDTYSDYPVKKVQDLEHQFIVPINDSKNYSEYSKTNNMLVNRFEIVKLK
ncbi:hypothetical protein [Sulfurimonas sp.]|uniref:hypothetical protein n=1 Tax=Sulfurimonas sp. TaxID=2022749 RepID=UPI003D0BF034